ncbi:MAG: Cobyrinic acid ac-diamide synthase [Candidatus Magnetoglobus multicellularis str. Araruama]|uniref:Cobyrinic acid ac-diamide synthase n=1 Tax=Candidatus Magnetoglobus multicellularis str. Araruama TaxID=890399 RepID=A0A1V1PE13_9BACT|nr:MAG: Cobyrinic acid ac-diamide synthase [Candidatus Magnetoglobus multicellularis str. Araruama]
MKKTTIFAVCGKGGVGKTCISALLVKMLSENHASKILAIDADPAVGLSYPLGIKVEKTVDDIRNDLIERLKKGEKTNRHELIKSLDYDIFNALEERQNLAFLAIGRPEGDGCYCQVNTLLKDLIKDIAQNFDYVVIDAEAGVEQISRRVMEMVTHLILVSDASLKGRNVVETINKIAKQKSSFEKCGLILNRLQDQDEYKSIKEQTDIPIIGSLFENKTIRNFDREGKCFFDLPEMDEIKALDSTIQSFHIY